MCLFALQIYFKGFILRISEKNDSLVPLDNGVLSYNNEFRTNVVPPENFSKRDWELFLTICKFCQNKKTQKGVKVTLNFDDLASYLSVNILKKVKKRFYEEVLEFAKKATDIVYKNEIYSDDGCEIYGNDSFFEKIKVSKTTQKVTFWISQKGLECINYLESFTQCNLYEFCAIQSLPGKMIFRVLIQHKNNKKIINSDGYKVLDFSKTEFIRIIKPELIGKSDKEIIERMKKFGSITSFDNSYIKPAIKELNNYFNYVDYKKVDNCNSRTSRKEQKYLLIFDDKNRDNKAKCSE